MFISRGFSQLLMKKFVARGELRGQVHLRSWKLNNVLFINLVLVIHCCSSASYSPCCFRSCWSCGSSSLIVVVLHVVEQKMRLWVDLIILFVFELLIRLTFPRRMQLKDMVRGVLLFGCRLTSFIHQEAIWLLSLSRPVPVQVNRCFFNYSDVITMIIIWLRSYFDIFVFTLLIIVMILFLLAFNVVASLGEIVAYRLAIESIVLPSLALQMRATNELHLGDWLLEVELGNCCLDVLLDGRVRWKHFLTLRMVDLLPLCIEKGRWLLIVVFCR